MACKEIDYSTHPDISFVQREISTWYTLAKQRFIADFDGDVALFPDRQRIKIYMNFYEGGDLQRVIERCAFNHQTLHPLTMTKWGAEIVRGLSYCHASNILHRDLKPANGDLPFLL